MATQFTEVSFNMEQGQLVTLNGPHGQGVTISGATGKITALIQSYFANVDPVKQPANAVPMVNIEQPFNIGGVVDPWIEIMQKRCPSVTDEQIQIQKDILASGMTLSSHWTSIQIFETAAIKNKDPDTFYRIFRLHNLSKNARNNVMNKIKRQDPEYRSRQNEQSRMYYANSHRN
jgi:hypothetical protein